MTIDVLNAQRPATRHRALIISATLLLASCALALQMTWWRSTGLLGAAISPAGWGMAFQPPNGFAPGEEVRTAIGRALPFHRVSSRGPAAELVVWRMTPQNDESPAELCAQILEVLRTEASRPPARFLVRPTETATQRSIGSRAAHEVRDVRSGTVVRASAVGPTAAICVSLRVSRPPITPELDATFERVCDSFVFDGD